MLQQNTPKDTLVNMRMHSSTKHFIDKAAQTSGKDRTDFILEAAYEKAEEVLMDRRFFNLDNAQWEEFNQLLDNPPEPNDKLKQLLATSAPWE